MEACGCCRTVCQENTKFVEELNNNVSSGADLYYGIQVSAYSYNHLPMQSARSDRRSSRKLLHAASDYRSFVETGIKQKSNDPSSQTHDWGEWQFYPAPVVQNFYDTQADPDDRNDPSSCEMGPATAGTCTSPTPPSPAARGTTSTTRATYRHFGAPQRASCPATGPPTRTTTSLVPAGARQLPRLMGRLAAQGCDYSQDSITDWAVNKANESQWYMVHTAPVPGQC